MLDVHDEPELLGHRHADAGEPGVHDLDLVLREDGLARHRDVAFEDDDGAVGAGPAPAGVRPADAAALGGLEDGLTGPDEEPAVLRRIEVRRGGLLEEVVVGDLPAVLGERLGVDVVDAAVGPAEQRAGAALAVPPDDVRGPVDGLVVEGAEPVDDGRAAEAGLVGDGVEVDALALGDGDRERLAGALVEPRLDLVLLEAVPGGQVGGRGPRFGGEDHHEPLRRLGLGDPVEPRPQEVAVLGSTC